MSAGCYGHRFDRALALVAEAFRHKRRKASGVPYIAHLLWVTATVAEHGGDEEQLIAALLHDYLEDVPGSTAEQLQAEFGPRVSRLVLALSDTTVHPKPPWLERKEGYLAHLVHQPAEVKLISAADKLHNLLSCVSDYRTAGDKLWARFRGGRQGTLWYFFSVHAALAQGWDHVLAREVGVQQALLRKLAGQQGEPQKPNPQ